MPIYPAFRDEKRVVKERKFFKVVLTPLHRVYSNEKEKPERGGANGGFNSLVYEMEW